MKFSVSEISDIIELAWDDQTDFSHINKIYNIDEGEVKKIMKKTLNVKVMRYGESALHNEVHKKPN